jgi:phage gp46-like protein
MPLEVRIDEGEQQQPTLFWDSRWEPWRGQADWAMADASEPQNRGGLASRAALHTAVVISLFTDKRIERDHPLFHLLEDGDQRGWFGDGVDVRADLFEDHMGSLLWIFERAYLNEEIRRQVELVSLEALQPLISQGAAVRIEVQAEAQFAINRVNLGVQIYGKDGSRLYDHKFEDIWAQTANPVRPIPFTTVPPEP